MRKLNNRVGLLNIFAGVLLIVVSAISIFVIFYSLKGSIETQNNLVEFIFLLVCWASGFTSLPMFILGIMVLKAGSRMFGNNDIIFEIRKESTLVVISYIALFVVFILSTAWGIAYSTCDFRYLSQYWNGIIFSGIIAAASLTIGIMLRINFWRLENVAFTEVE